MSESQERLERGEQTAPRPDEEVAESLEALGMSDEESSAFVRLSLRGPRRVVDLARDLGMTRQDAYRLLHRMMDRGFVASDVTRPTTYRAVPAAEIFASAVTREAARVEALKRADARIGRALARLPSPPAGVTEPSFRVIKGRGEILGTVERLVRSARAILRIASTHPATIDLGEISGLIDLVQARAVDGVEVRALMGDRGSSLVSRGSIEIRSIAGPTAMGAVIVDEAEILTTLVSDPSRRLHAEGDVSLWTDAGDFVRTQCALFDALWSMATPLAAR